MNLRFGLLRSVAGRSPASGHDWLCWSWWSYLPKWRPTRLIQSHVDRECWQDTGARADSRAYGLSDALTDSKYWVDFDDFFFYRMDVLDVYYVGGFGVMGWVAASEYSQAQFDPLVEHKSDIMQHMNADHKDALILLAKRFSGIEAQEAEMTSVDRLGFHLRLKTQDGVKGIRVAFSQEVSGPAESREVFIEMVRQARQG